MNNVQNTHKRNAVQITVANSVHALFNNSKSNTLN